MLKTSGLIREVSGRADKKDHVGDVSDLQSPCFLNYLRFASFWCVLVSLVAGFVSCQAEDFRFDVII